ncbi:MAG: 50S ribosomal protein L22 [Acidimicrobiia bacterium]|nr:50S ribosomal protein L22 [Acidimicrobiia bacterium]NNC42285.1 50S ribosomal protein L22 [Acidimicrobiia bacterium]NND13516.1 50S ribosomal protein L22 [Acidimicrobiia bacterium]NNL48502.1 50S ribosomal protein L22 [Acidimicrobiia bacterium]
MKVRARAMHVRQSPFKVRRVLDLIRGLPASEAETILAFTNRRATEPIGKVLKSAIANAEHNHSIDKSELVVSECYADEGPTLKRFKARARGRGTRIEKRTSHITVVVSDEISERTNA